MSGPLRIRARGEIDPGRWNDFVDASDEAWLWHRGEAIDALASWPGQSDASFAVTNRDGGMMAVMALHRVAARAARVVKVARFNSLGGPACATGLSPVERAGVIEHLRQHLHDVIDEARAVALQIQIAALTPSQWAARPHDPIRELGLEDESGQTWIVDLARPAEDIRRGYSELTRRELRKATKSGVRLREAAGPRDLDAYYRLHLETYARTSARAHPLDYFQAIFERFQPRGLARVLLAERDGEIVAAQNTARYKGGAVYWTGASASEKSGGENRLLFDAQIMAAREDGLLRYETGQAFVESNDAKERGLSQFKRSFGATLRPYHRGLLPATRAGRRLLWGLRRMARSMASARS